MGLNLQFRTPSRRGLKTCVRLKPSKHEIRDVALAELVIHIGVLKPAIRQAVRFSNTPPFHRRLNGIAHSLHVPMFTCYYIAIFDDRLQTLKNRATPAFCENMQVLNRRV